uniref:PID domain-containing protein n=1 Tax=Anolis carolinensis TaxID=28377 RepID=A0A803TYH9_ANOCA
MTAWSAVTFPPERYLLIYSHWHKRFRLWYVGCSCLDRRTTLPMLPWLMAEIRRRSQKPEPSAVPPREVLLLLGSPTLRCVPSSSSSAAASASNPAVFIFEHKAQHIARFVHNSHDLTYFAYLIKAQPEDPDSRMACHVFRAAEPGQASPAGGTEGGREARRLRNWGAAGDKLGSGSPERSFAFPAQEGWGLTQDSI